LHTLGSGERRAETRLVSHVDVPVGFGGDGGPGEIEQGRRATVARLWSRAEDATGLERSHERAGPP
jgi:hypothetical protein